MAILLNTLTFGIELEFICLRPQTLFHPDHVPVYPGCEETGVGVAIWEALFRNGIPAVGWEPLDADLNDSAPSFSRWRVETDSLHLSEDEERLLPTGWITEAVEISSRKLRFFTEDWRDELATVLQVLREVETEAAASSRINRRVSISILVWIASSSHYELQRMCSS
jgi:hypothetical protein